ncbi:sulfatase-like hydrolase/transferase [Kribbella pittospori]|uniref:sulfatase-like hydrolase/transferase n=1 Tax=Kribbella pittospori TaxID=722689 RepID=UPI0013F497DF|nr:sulfatase-like hydrolase/transferase [Kribbella pittospori]
MPSRDERSDVEECPDAATNVVVVIADQLRRDALAIYGDPNVSTPNLDALASAGARFTNACSTYPVCVPFRFSLVTGEYAHTRGVPAIEWRMSPAERTLADEFNDAGYDTAFFGKWHLYGGNGGVLPSYPNDRARRTHIPRAYQGRWQHFAGFELCNDPFNTTYFVNDDPTPRAIEGYQTDGLFDLAIDYIGQRATTERPFCCVISVEPPHPPLTAPDKYLSRWSDRPLRLRPNFADVPSYRPRRPGSTGLLDDLRGYYAAIENLDDNIGRLRDTLSAEGLWQRTVVLFTSDHGEFLGSHGLTAKCDPREESSGIPLIVAGGGLPANRHIEDPVCTEDLFPTILGLARLSPRDPRPGEDLAALIRGDVPNLARPGVMLEHVAEYRPRAPFHDQSWRAFRTTDFIYAVLGGADGGRPWLFYDLEKDPGQQTNLVNDADRIPDMARLHNLLRQRMQATDDHYFLAPAHGEPGLNDWRP